MSQLYTNNGLSKIAGPITATDTTINILPGDGSLFPVITHPEEWFYATLEDRYATVREIVKVVATNGDTFQVIRGQETFPARAWDDENTLFDCRITAGTLSSFKVKKDFIVGVLANQTRDIDSVNLGLHSSTTVQWTISVDSVPDSKIYVTKILATYSRFSNKIYFNETDTLGDDMDISFEVREQNNYIHLSCSSTIPHGVNIHVSRNPS